MASFMKRITMVIAVAAMIIAAGCSRTDKQSGQSQQDQISTSQETPVVLNAQLNSKIGSWAVKGKECYGIVMTTLKNGKVLAKSVKCKIMVMQPDQLKMKAIESVSLMGSAGCDRMGLKYGETWWEKDGDLFLTREEADAFILKQKWVLK